MGNPAEEIVCSPDQCLRDKLISPLKKENKTGAKWLKIGAKYLAHACETLGSMFPVSYFYERLDGISDEALLVG